MCRLLLCLLAAFAFLVSNGTIPLSLQQIASYLGYSVLALVALFFPLESE